MPDSSTAQEKRSYQHPPVVEAVIEIRLAQNVASDRIQQVADKVKNSYFFIDPEQHIDVNFDVTKQTTNVKETIFGYRISTLDRDELIMARTDAFVCARLAPYTGWEKLIGRAMRDWAIWKKIVGHQKLARIGIRYINRIDIPTGKDPRVLIEEYLSLYPKIPDGPIPALSNFAMQISGGAGVENYGVTINIGAVPSPLLDHTSFALDLDLYRDVMLPQRDEEMWSMIREMRDIKNRVFESCITDKTRRMFEQ